MTNFLLQSELELGTEEYDQKVRPHERKKILWIKVDGSANKSGSGIRMQITIPDGM